MREEQDDKTHIKSQGTTEDILEGEGWERKAKGNNLDYNIFTGLLRTGIPNLFSFITPVTKQAMCLYPLLKKYPSSPRPVAEKLNSIFISLVSPFN